jgi:hypothetical protein
MFDPINDEKYPVPVRMSIPAGELSVLAANAQRSIDYNWVAKHVPQFNEAYLGVAAVSLRPDGRFHVIDGQHRVELTKQVMGPNYEMDCEVFEGLSLKQEARIFLDRNDRKPIPTYPQFVANITAGDEVALGVVDILKGLGLTHSAQKRAGSVCAVAALQRVYRLTNTKGEPTGKLALSRALHVLQRAFGDGAASFESHLIEGLGLFYVRYGSQIETDRLVVKLSTYKGGAPGLLGTARSVREQKSKSVARCVASVVTDLYNKGRRSGSLGDWWAKAK